MCIVRKTVSSIILPFQLALYNHICTLNITFKQNVLKWPWILLVFMQIVFWQFDIIYDYNKGVLWWILYFSIMQHQGYVDWLTWWDLLRKYLTYNLIMNTHSCSPFMKKGAQRKTFLLRNKLLIFAPHGTAVDSSSTLDVFTNNKYA